jgi:hypothetical protein
MVDIKRLEKLKKFRAELKIKEVDVDANKNADMKVDDLRCAGCGFLDDYKEFKRRGEMTICSRCNGSEIFDFYGLPYNHDDAKRRKR